MSYNGSGTFQINTSGQPVVAGTVISSTAFNALTADLATGLSTAITKDGQTATTVRIPFAQGISSTLTTDSSSVSTGSIITAGGVGIAKALYVGTNANVAGTLAVTGVATFSAAPIYSSLTASSAVATDASKALVSVTNTGTGNNVLATSPTLVTPILGTPASGSLVNCTDTNYTGFKNRIINGQMQIAQRATSATITAGSTIAAGYSTVDRFYVYCTGANVTAAQVAGSGAIKNNLEITGGASVTEIGVGQRIEQLNSYDMAGSNATLSVNLSNSLLTTVTWTAYYANTADTFGTLVSPTRTQIATGTFTVTATLTNYSTQISIPAAATTGIEVVFTVGAQTSGTWVVGDIQLEKGSTATSFDYRPYGTELALCQRYYQLGAGFTTGYAAGSTTMGGIASLGITMRSAPTAVVTSAGAPPGANFSGSPTAGTTTTTYIPVTWGTNGAAANAYAVFNYTASSEL